MNSQNKTDYPPIVFGREATLEHLAHRVQQCGVTAIAGGAMTGKSAVLLELDRRLCADGRYLVGIYEAKAGEVSHFLYAIANLYERWLADASMREQAAILWKKHAPDSIPLIGQAFGRMLKALAGTDTAGIAELVSNTFDGLKRLNEELKGGGLSFSPLPYDQTRDLANLVADITGKRIVLILDEWGNSANPLHERQTLEAFLKHTREWRRTHIVLAVRHPIVEQREAEDLTFLRRSELAQEYDLPPLELASEFERRRLLVYLRERVPASTAASDEELIQLIGGMPGVVSRWIEGVALGSVVDLQTLRQRANEAHSFRYTDLTRALDRLSNEEKLLCARVAFLPGLNRKIWGGCRAAVLDGLDISVLDGLIGHVFERHPEDIGIPTFGHETRHDVAWRHIASRRPHLMARVADSLIQYLAAEISALEEKVALPVAILASRERLIVDLDCAPVSRFLVAAAASLMRKGGFTTTDFVDIPELRAAVLRNCGIVLLVGMGLVNRGIKYLQDGEIGMAENDFTAVIELPDVPDYPLTRALYNRARCRQRLNDRGGASADLEASQRLREKGPNEAQWMYRYATFHFELGQYSEALSNYNSVVGSDAASRKQRGMALLQRGVVKYMLKDAPGALGDLSAAYEIEEMPIEYRAAALSHRGHVKQSMGDVQGALDDFCARIELPVGPLPGTGLALAYLARAFGRRVCSDLGGALSDFGSAINSEDAAVQERAQALLERGILLEEQEDFSGALEDFSRLIELGSEADEYLSKGYLARGALLRKLNQTSDASADFLAAAATASDPIIQIKARQAAERLMGAMKTDW